MNKYLVNYADKFYYYSQKKNRKTGKRICGFNECFAFSRSDLDAQFIQKNKLILDQAKGAGYWLWKPYVILKALSRMLHDDLLFYSDSGAYFLNPLDAIIPSLDETREKLLLFALDEDQTQAKWTKRDCFILMDLDHEAHVGQSQILASFLLMRKNDFVIKFVNEWLEYAQDYRVITDSPNECGKPNYPAFVDHRHDQSILSLLGRKYGIKTLPDISQHGNARRPPSIPQIIKHTRRKTWLFG